MIKSQRKSMLEIIINHSQPMVSDKENQRFPYKEQVFSYIYHLSPQPQLYNCEIELLGTPKSPIRQHILSNRHFSSINLMKVSSQMKLDKILVQSSHLRNRTLQPEEKCFSDIISDLKDR